ncbi:tetratricopeptide repeat protein [candidate division WOR-3 bacterium]|nr:tetratricopeptide repeat protein [candidate division WOR-3 bacterium]
MFIRDKELTRIKNISNKFRNKEKFGGIVYLYGPAGMGKAFLLNKFCDDEKDFFNICYMQTDNVLKKDMNPFVFFFENFFEQDILKTERERKESYERIYTGFLDSLSEKNDTVIINEIKRIKSILAGLIGIYYNNSLFESLTPKDKYISIKIAVKEFFKALSLLKPVIIVLENVQWLDQESLNFFRIFFRNIERFPILIIASGESEQSNVLSINIDSKIKTTPIELKKFSLMTVKKMIKAILEKSCAERVCREIAEKAEYNPFLIEQICLYSKEQRLIKFSGKSYDFSNGAGFSFVKSEAMIFSRIDSLAENVKNFLLTSSALGKSCPSYLISGISELLQGTRGEKTISESVEKAKSYKGECFEVNEISHIFNVMTGIKDIFISKYGEKIKEIHRLAMRIYKEKPSEIYTENLGYLFEKIDNKRKAFESYSKSGEYAMERYSLDTALSLFRKALSISGEDANLAIPVYISISKVYFEKSDFSKSLEYLNKAMEHAKRIGSRSDLAEIYICLGKIYHRKAEFKTATEFFKRALLLKNKLLGVKHPDCAKLSILIGRVAFDWGRKCKKAVDSFEKALAVQIEILGNNHLDTSNTFNDLGIVYGYKGEYVKALECLDKAQCVDTKNESIKKITVAKNLNNRAVIFYNNKKYKKSFENALKALEIYREILGEKHYLTAYAYHNTASILDNIDKEDKRILEFYRISNTIFKELSGEEHIDVAVSYNNIGSFHLGKKDYSKAAKYFDKAYKIYLNRLGEKNYLTALTLNQTGKCFYFTKHYNKATIFFKKALAGCKGDSEDAAALRTEIYSYLSEVYKKEGFLKKASYYRRKIRIETRKKK